MPAPATDLTKMSDDDLRAVYRAAQTANAPSDLSKLSDAELLAAFHAAQAKDSGTPDFSAKPGHDLAANAAANRAQGNTSTLPGGPLTGWGGTVAEGFTNVGREYGNLAVGIATPLVQAANALTPSPYQEGTLQREADDVDRNNAMVDLQDTGRHMRLGMEGLDYEQQPGGTMKPQIIADALTRARRQLPPMTPVEAGQGIIQNTWDNPAQQTMNATALVGGIAGGAGLIGRLRAGVKARAAGTGIVLRSPEVFGEGQPGTGTYDDAVEGFFRDAEKQHQARQAQRAPAPETSGSPVHDWFRENPARTVDQAARHFKDKGLTTSEAGRIRNEVLSERPAPGQEVAPMPVEVPPEIQRSAPPVPSGSPVHDFFRENPMATGEDAVNQFGVSIREANAALTDVAATRSAPAPAPPSSPVHDFFRDNPSADEADALGHFGADHPAMKWDIVHQALEDVRGGRAEPARPATQPEAAQPTDLATLSDAQLQALAQEHGMAVPDEGPPAVVDPAIARQVAPQAGASVGASAETPGLETTQGAPPVAQTPETDAQNVTTAVQQPPVPVEWPPHVPHLPDTAIKDEAGLPKRMYHGSGMVGFDKFTVDEGNPDLLYGPGIYFTDNTDVASGYAMTTKGKPTEADFANVYTPGEIIKDGSGQPNKVISYDPGDGTSPWNRSVTTITVKPDGSPIIGERPRTYTPNEDTVVDNLRTGKRRHPLAAVTGDMTPEGVRPGVIPVYLDIKRPLSMDTPISQPDYQSVYDAVQRDVDRQSENLTAHVKKRGGKRSDYITPTERVNSLPEWSPEMTGRDMYKALVGEYGGAAAGAKIDVFPILKDAGFDGIVHTGGVRKGNSHNVAIAFDPDQVIPAFRAVGTPASEMPQSQTGDHAMIAATLDGGMASASVPHDMAADFHALDPAAEPLPGDLIDPETGQAFRHKDADPPSEEQKAEEHEEAAGEDWGEEAGDPPKPGKRRGGRPNRTQRGSVNIRLPSAQTMAKLQAAADEVSDFAVQNFKHLRRHGSPETYDAAVYLAYAPSHAAALMNSSMVRIAHIMADEGGDAAFRSLMVENRQRGMEDRWDRNAAEVAAAAPTNLVDVRRVKGVPVAYVADEWDTPINALTKYPAFKEADTTAHDFAQEAISSNNYDPVRNYLRLTFEDARDNVWHVPGLEPGAPGDPFTQRTSTPAFRQALNVWRNDFETNLIRSHAENEGVTHQDLGPLGTYYPGVPLDENGALYFGRPGRGANMSTPKNLHNEYATGQAPAYSTSANGLRNSMRDSFQRNGQAALMKHLEADGLKLDGDDPRVIVKPPKPRRNTVQQTYDQDEGRPELSIRLPNGGETEAVEVQTDFHGGTGVVPKWLARELGPSMPKDSLGWIDKRYHLRVATPILNALNRGGAAGPMDFILHGNNEVGQMAAAVARLQGTPLAANSILTKKLAAIVAAARVDPMSALNSWKVGELARIGALPERYGSETYSHRVAEQTGAHVNRLSMMPWIWSNTGFDVRARIVMLDAAKVANGLDPNHPLPDDPRVRASVRDSINQLGIYNRSAESELSRFMKDTGVAPFYTAGSTMHYNGLRYWLGGGGRVPNAGGPAGRRAAAWWARQASAGLAALVAAWYISYEAYWHRAPDPNNPDDRLFDIPLRPEHRMSPAVQAIAPGSDPLYISLGAFSPIGYRGAGELGLRNAWGAKAAGAGPGMTQEEALRGMMNAAGHPVMSGPGANALIAAGTLHHPYITSLRDATTGHPGNVYKSVPGDVEPGAWGQTRTRAVAAVLGLNSGFGQAMGDVGVGPEFDPRDDEPWQAKIARAAINLGAGNLIKGPYDTNAQEKSMHRKERAAERAADRTPGYHAIAVTRHHGRRGR